MKALSRTYTYRWTFLRLCYPKGVQIDPYANLKVYVSIGHVHLWVYIEEGAGINMRTEFRILRAKQLERALEVFAPAKNSPRPQKGWIRAVREATGISLRQMAVRLKKAPTLAAKLEKSEA